MERVTGIGGILFKAEDPKAMRAWYGNALGLPIEEYGCVFRWREDKDPAKIGQTT